MNADEEQWDIKDVSIKMDALCMRAQTTKPQRTGLVWPPACPCLMHSDHLGNETSVCSFVTVKVDSGGDSKSLAPSMLLSYAL